MIKTRSYSNKLLIITSKLNLIKLILKKFQC